MMAQQMGLAPKTPVQSNAEFEAAKKSQAINDDLPDFEKLMAASNAVKYEEIEKEKEATGNPEGGLRIGETKNDKEFREMLEKVTGKKDKAVKNKLDKDDYLNLMVTQLKHQDPFKPMDNQEMATQLAQFNTVEQLISANKTLTDMNKAQSEAKVEKLTPYLGKHVQVNGDKIRVGTDKSVSDANFEIPAEAGVVNVLIKDASGKVVRSLPMPGLKPGEHKVAWDGKDEKGVQAPSGQYTFTIDATTLDGKPLKAKSSFTAKVDAITDLSKGGKLGTTSGPVDVSEIVAIRSVDESQTKTAATANGATAPAGAATPGSQAASNTAPGTTPANNAQPNATQANAAAPGTAPQQQAPGNVTAQNGAPAQQQAGNPQQQPANGSAATAQNQQGTASNAAPVEGQKAAEEKSAARETAREQKKQARQVKENNKEEKAKEPVKAASAKKPETEKTEKPKA